jgi:calcineurin-like phosphoesterase family protein
VNILGDIDIIGDTHGFIRSIARWAETSDTRNLIHVGDYGVGFSGWEKPTKSLASLLDQNNKTLFIIRGNHDDPSKFCNQSFLGKNGGGIHLVQDGTVATWGEEKILFNGGGISIDRSKRVQGISYWDDEKFKSVEVSETFDHLVTHISLTSVQGHSIQHPFVLSWASDDSDLVTDLYQEQQELSNWIDYLFAQGNRIKSWYYGHYHKSIWSRYNETKCVGLDINEIKPFNRSEYGGD